MDKASTDILNSGINNCDQVEYYIDRYEDNPFINCQKLNAGATECAQCLDGFGLDTANKKRCYINTVLLAANCQKLQNLDASKCQTCAPGFYLNGLSDGCVDASASITNCAIYTSATICQTCAPNYGLGAGKTSCIQSPNCKQTRADDGTLCELCNPGWVLNSDHKCYVHITVDNCAEYSDDKFTCTKC